MYNNLLVNGDLIIYQIKKFIKDKRGGDDKQASSGIAILTAIVLGGLVLTTMYGFFNDEFFPAIKQKLMDMLNFSG